MAAIWRPFKKNATLTGWEATATITVEHRQRADSCAHKRNGEASDRIRLFIDRFYSYANLHSKRIFLFASHITPPPVRMLSCTFSFHQHQQSFTQWFASLLNDVSLRRHSTVFLQSHHSTRKSKSTSHSPSNIEWKHSSKFSRWNSIT